eukprot:CAMPEP_0185754436 /NCGR_PEP_ID=MMETSP1174-20130828/13077_1 /TAXON_ID=35687 /ORGANISM="Dictyocha speculum, Strain CCMP1381" /LENGTH=266 /DNA_ID=CAMNT_0028432633 /DNA_START=161 /DNA_END=961 /DNA_ORIENTATION=-
MNLTLDHFYPSPEAETEGGRPAIVFVHGGSYCIEDSSDFWDQAEWFASRGFSAFSINYRLAKDDGLYPAGWEEWLPPFNESSWWANNWNHMYPAVRDAKASLRWIRAHAHDLGVNAAALVAYGGSAGACTTIGLGSLLEGDYKDELVGIDPTLEGTHLTVSSSVAAVVDHWGAVYAVDAVQWKDGQQRYGPLSAPTIAFHGLNDTTIVPENSIWLCDETLVPAGGECALHLIPNQTHGCWDATVGPDNRTQDEVTLSWLSEMGLAP